MECRVGHVPTLGRSSLGAGSWQLAAGRRQKITRSKQCTKKTPAHTPERLKPHVTGNEPVATAWLSISNHAVPFAVPSTLAIAHPQPVSRPVANKITHPLSISAVRLATALTISKISYTLPLAHSVPLAPVPVSQAQWTTQLHTRQQVALTGEELHPQPYPTRRVASPQECKGESITQACFALSLASLPEWPLMLRQIVVEALTRNVKEDHIREIFGKYGVIKDVRMPMNPTCTYHLIASQALG